MTGFEKTQLTHTITDIEILIWSVVATLGRKTDACMQFAMVL